MKTEDKRVRPFWSGTHFGDWEDRNCNKCTKSFATTQKEGGCELDSALLLAYWDDGTLSVDHANRIGFDDSDGTHRGCTEIVEVK